MSKKGNGWGVFWIGVFLFGILPKLIAGDNKKMEWTLRLIFLGIILSPFWIGFLDLILKGKIP